jgi:DNA polymerase elongation subunit (family B)
MEGRRESSEGSVKIGADFSVQVVYGDTDSLFVHLPGRTKDQAFRIGNEIADAVTSVNPRPVKLKFEKVSPDYRRCEAKLILHSGLHQVLADGQKAIRRFQV